MKPSVIAASCIGLLLSAAAVIAQTPPPQPGERSKEMTSTPAPSSPNATADEAQARNRLQDKGYGDIRGLAPNSDGSHSGKALRDGREVDVTIDSHGNVRQR